ncbi:MAG: retropepsin-like domain-containing protein [Bacteroidales bacterium]|nr:retropepsin-like domain-containing protein [Bacteroidales bacterium]
MPYCALLLVALICIPACNSASRNEKSDHTISRLEGYYEQEHYFRFHNYFFANAAFLPGRERLYFHSLIDQAFYRHASSNQKIDKLLRRYRRSLSDQEITNLHRAKYMNHYNLFEYESALEECNLLISDHESNMDSAEYRHLFNERKILNAISHMPAQTITKMADSHIRLKKDKRGLLNIPLKINSDSIDFLFDTGSSFSFISRSIAEKSGMSIFDVDFEVEGATGNVVVCDVGVIDSFSMGNILVQNSVFWIFEDADLSLPEYDYSVNGAIAFPILRALEEFHYGIEEYLFIPEKTMTYNNNNLAINDLDPVIAVRNGTDTLPFYFDTGSSFTSLYKPYFDLYKEKITNTYQIRTYNIGSLGGVVEFSSYIIDSMLIECGGQSAAIYDIETHTDYIYKDAEKVYGNLGQDFIYQFEHMIISTKHASVLFE